MVTVTFTYNEAFSKWEPVVDGAENAQEASDAFAAVVITCKNLNTKMLAHSKSIPLTKYGIIPAV